MRAHEDVAAVIVPALQRPITEEGRLAVEFLSTLRDERQPWAAEFERFADLHELGPELRRATRVACLRLRMFSAVERYERRRARARR